MRVVSLVPSWTETLLAAGVEVLGRTRYCLYPKELVTNIPVVGGTKDWDFAKIQTLKPDLILLDREENPKFMAEQTEFETFATHVQNVDAVAAELQRLRLKLDNLELARLAERWRTILALPDLPAWNYEREIPALLEWGQKPEVPIERVLYLIWKKPWMTIGRQTFIASMLMRLGFKTLLPDFAKPYPEIDLKNFARESTLLLFSSEPFPFLKKKSELAALGFPHAFVDGESLSWFGLRSLIFLENLARG